jgi:hypothetical protein
LIAALSILRLLFFQHIFRLSLVFGLGGHVWYSVCVVWCSVGVVYY